VELERRLGSLAVDIDGGGDAAPPLVLLHGLTFDRSMWRPIRERVSTVNPARQIVAFDLPGHGGSDPQVDYRVDAVAATVHQAVSEVGVAAPVVVGHSVSGLIATVYAARYATRGVVNVDQPLDVTAFAELVRSLEVRLHGPDFPALWGMFEASFHAELLPSEMQELVRSVTHVDRDVVLGYWRQIFELSTPALLALVDDALAEVRARHVRYTYVSGSAVDPSYATWLTHRLPNVEIIAWPDSSHFPQLAHPDAFADILRATAGW
jgi:pimeloyl-ACP methyl ester carboxylesterase